MSGATTRPDDIRPRRRLAASLCQKHQVPVRSSYRLQGKDACVLCLLEQQGMRETPQQAERKVRR